MSLYITNILLILEVATKLMPVAVVIVVECRVLLVVVTGVIVAAIVEVVIDVMVDVNTYTRIILLTPLQLL